MIRSATAAIRLAAALGLLGALTPAHAQAPDKAAQKAEIEAAWKAGAQAGTHGPADIKLADQATLSLPDDYFYIPKAEGVRILRALGNRLDDQTHYGLVVGTRQGDDWIVVVRYIKEGYIKDDEAKTWDADKLLDGIKSSTDAANKDRVARGFPELEIIGWVEPPAYDSDTHRLVWSLLSRRKGEPNSIAKEVNYNTYALGRDGYFSLNLLTSSARIETDKAAAHTLLAALAYDPGKRYTDFNAATDHIAAYGIAALVGGLAAKKLGLLALGGALLLKFAKLIAVGVAALVGGFWRLFGRRRRDA